MFTKTKTPDNLKYFNSPSSTANNKDYHNQLYSPMWVSAFRSVGVFQLHLSRGCGCQPQSNPQPGGPETLLSGLPYINRGEPVLRRQVLARFGLGFAGCTDRWPADVSWF